MFRFWGLLWLNRSITCTPLRKKDQLKPQSVSTEPVTATNIFKHPIWNVYSYDVLSESTGMVFGWIQNQSPLFLNGALKVTVHQKTPKENLPSQSHSTGRPSATLMNNLKHLKHVLKISYIQMMMETVDFFWWTILSKKNHFIKILKKGNNDKLDDSTLYIIKKKRERKYRKQSNGKIEISSTRESHVAVSVEANSIWECPRNC